MRKMSSPRVTILTGYKPHYEGWLLRTLHGTYWGARYTKENLARALKNSVSFWGVPVIDGRLAEEPVAYARVLSDSVTVSFVLDCVVEEALRGKGIGTQLMTAVMEHSVTRRGICILQTRVPKFYERFGFVTQAGEFMMRGGEERS